MRKKSQTLSQDQTRSCALGGNECLHVEPRAECRSLVAMSSKEIGPQIELRLVGAHFQKERRHQRDSGQQVFDGEVGNDHLILSYHGRNAVFGNGFHDEKARKEREKSGGSMKVDGSRQEKKWGNSGRVSIYVTVGNTRL